MQFRHQLDFGHKMAAVCVQSFRLMQGSIAIQDNVLYQVCPNVPNWLITYILKYLTIENIHKRYGNTTFKFTHTQECHTLAYTLTFTHLDGGLGGYGARDSRVQTVEPSFYI